jgi:glycosyltransferase involved in cell wall biosynthesis
VLAFKDIAKNLSAEGRQTKLSIIAIKPARNSVGLRPDFLKDSRAITRKSGGNVYLIENLMQPSDNYFNFDVWETYNNSARNIIDDITEPHDRTIVIANDVIFAQTYGSGINTYNVWMPHSIASAHAQSYVDATERINWEMRAATRIRRDANSYMGSASPAISKLLRGVFDLSGTKILPLYYGFYLPTYSPHYSQKAISKVLVDHNIPTDKKLLFSFGRADEYKGLDIALEAMIKIAEEHSEYHAVLIASRFSKEGFIDGLQSRLRNIVKQSPRASLFLDYEFELPKYLLQHNKTAFLFNLPTRDYCPLIPFEAQIIGNKQLCVINSSMPCFNGIVHNDVDGFLCDSNVLAAVQCFEHIESLPAKKRQAIIKNGKLRTLQAYDITQNYGNAIKSLSAIGFDELK